MKVDTAPTSAAQVAPEERVAQVKQTVQTLRRRWWLLAVLCLLGVTIGWVTTPNAPDPIAPSDRYYKATHTLLVDTSADPTPGYNPGTSLQQAAYLASTGDVPVRVAEVLGVEIDGVTQNIGGTARADVSSLEITAIGRDPEKTIALSNTTAQELVTYLDEIEAQRFNDARDDVLTKLDELKVERDRLDAEIADGAPDSDLLTQERDSIVNQYRLTYEQFQALANAAQPGAGLSTIETANAVEISGQAYRDRKNTIVAGGSAVTPTSVAEVPSELPPTDPNPVLRAGVGGALGLLIAVVVILVWDRLDTRVRRRDEVEAATGLPVLAEVPPLTRHQRHETEVLAASTPRSHTAESFRVIRTALMLAAETDKGSNGTSPIEPDGRVVMVTSAGPDEGKTTTVANLAAVLAEGGLSVLVVDCDFRRPRIHKYLLADADAEPKSGGAASGEVDFTRIDGVKLVTGVGQGDDANPLEVVARQKRMIEVARKHFEIVLLDTAPFLMTNDASELVPESDTVLFVVRAGATKREAASRAAEFLRRINAPTLGAILTNADDTPAAYYYYSYYLDSESKPENGRRRPSALAGGSADRQPNDRARKQAR